MKECNDWKLFMNSGKVQDYLSYRESSKSIQGVSVKSSISHGKFELEPKFAGFEASMGVSVNQNLSCNEDKIQSGASPNAGFFGNNGIGTTGGSYRGL